MKIVIQDIEVDLKVGADPEIFVECNNSLISAHGLVQGTKEKPYPVNKGAIQVDGMALEFNINPAESLEEFVDNINEVMKQLVGRLPLGMKLSALSTANFGSEYINKQPRVARDLGCSADYNAYTGKTNPKPNIDTPFRTAAGHIHIGWTSGADYKCDEYMDLCCEFTKVLDLYLGLPSVLLDSDVKRRELYGKAGAFRAKDYGVEYRVLSNFWLQSKPLMAYVYSQTHKALVSFLKGFRINDSELVDTINNSDVNKANLLINKFKIEVPHASKFKYTL
jgi:hypothetical protein